MSFRRWIIALAVLALFAGLAGAQTNPSCVATSTPVTMRSESLTDMIGDILITCTGGTPLVPGALIPQATFTVTLPANVTSRLLGNGSVPNASEAVLIVNDVTPGTGTICGAPATGCGPYTSVLNTTTGNGAYPANVGTFQGLVTGNQVTFIGVPVVPPGSTGATTFRITNVRMNSAGVGASGTTTTPVQASIMVGVAANVINPVITVGTVTAGLASISGGATFGVRNASNTASVTSSNGTGTQLAQCSTQSSPSGVAVLQFVEGFGTSFKPRVAPTTTYPGSGIPNPVGTGYLQNIPGNILAGTAYAGAPTNSSESGLIIPSLVGTQGATAGLADFGTRLKATFTNIPAGVRIFVTNTNLIATNLTTGGATISPVPTGTSTGVFAQLITGETAASTFGVPVLPSTTSINGSTTALTEITPPAGSSSATAVWEILNANPNAVDIAAFGVYTQYVAAPSATPPSPALGTGQVQLSFAPTFDTTANPGAGAASASLPIPRFVIATSPVNFINVFQCLTSLMFPFVTNQGGFDTGIAISNTTSDPYGTRNQAGTCTLNFFGSPTTAAQTTASIGAGQQYVAVVSSIAPGFQGYMIVQCNFQLAHGFVFISDVGARNLAMGYLALVMPTGTGTRNNITEALSQ